MKKRGKHLAGTWLNISTNSLEKVRKGVLKCLKKSPNCMKNHWTISRAGQRDLGRLHEKPNRYLMYFDKDNTECQPWAGSTRARTKAGWVQLCGKGTVGLGGHESHTHEI